MSAFDDYLNAPTAAPVQSFNAYLGSSSTNSAIAPAPSVQQPGMLASGVTGFGKGIGSVAAGIEQLAGKGIGAVGNFFAPSPNLSSIVTGQQPQNMLQRAGKYLSNDADYNLSQLNQGAAAAEQAHPFVTGAGNIAGQIVGTAPTMAIGPAYAGLGLGGRVALGAAQGAAGAGMLPASDQDFWSNKAQQVGLGGLLGGATPLVAAGARAVGQGLWNAARPVIQPTQFVGEGLAGAMNPQEAAQAASNIRGAQQFVPGSMPTTAQVAQTPVMVQTEKAAANIPAFKTAVAQRAIDNNDARWQSLMGIAQTPEALQAARTAREDATFPLYSAAGDQTANAGKALVNLFQRPAMRQAAQQADQLAANRGETLVWPQQGGDMSINGRALDYTNRALGDMIGSAKSSGNKELASGLADAQGQLNAWTSRYIPAQRQAAQAYAQLSVPVNTMEVGQAIANGLGTRAMNAGGAPEIGLMPFRSALTSAMKNAPYGIDANALGALQGIGQDLQRATVSNSIKSPGSDTAYNLAANGWLARQLYGPTFGGAGNIGKAVGAIGATALGHPMAGLGILGAGNKLGQMVGGRLQDRLTGLLMDPNAALPYLDARAAAPTQAIPGPLMQGFLNYGRPALLNGLLGGIQNSGNK